jgi:hypothetical protein
MSDIQGYEQRVSRLSAARGRDSASKRTAVLAAIAELKREDRQISRRVVITRAGVHRNFLQRHKDLAALIDDAANRGPRSQSQRATRSPLRACEPSWPQPNNPIVNCANGFKRSNAA